MEFQRPWCLFVVMEKLDVRIAGFVSCLATGLRNSNEHELTQILGFGSSHKSGFSKALNADTAKTRGKSY
jgi:hypothetical protein